MEGAYEWREDDFETLRGATLVLAADVVYDCAATEALVTTLGALLRRHCPLPGYSIGSDRTVQYSIVSIIILHSALPCTTAPRRRRL